MVDVKDMDRDKLEALHRCLTESMRVLIANINSHERLVTREQLRTLANHLDKEAWEAANRAT